MVAVY